LISKFYSLTKREISSGVQRAGPSIQISVWLRCAPATALIVKSTSRVSAG